MASTSGRRVVEYLTNKSGGAVAAGDVVIIDTANNDSFTTNTTSGFLGMIGVAQEAISNNAAGRVLTAGYAALVNVNASVTRGNYGKTYTVAKQATDAGSSRASGAFCQFLTGGTTPTAHLFGLADASTSSGGISSGTSNPGGPATNDLFFRTDLGYLIYYDGTRWLTLNEFQTTLVPYDVLAPYTATNSNLFGPTDNTTYEQWITRLVVTTILTNATTASNYFVGQLTSQPAGGGTSNIGSTFTTQSDTQNNNVKHTVTIGAAVTTAHTRLNLTMTETGTASWYAEAVVFYRRIIT